MTQYHNPYHFVPVTNSPRNDDLSVDDFLDNDTQHVTHDQYVEGTYSGRIICRLSTETPVFIGAKRTKEATDQAPAEVAPFKLDGQPAIPASSLRGLISSLAETASNSAMRVLENKTYSFRRPMTESLSAIGMVIEINDQYHLRPLTLPTIRLNGNNPARLRREFSAIFREPNLKVYVGNSTSIKSPKFPYETFSINSPKYYGLKLRKRAWSHAKDLTFDNEQHVRNGFLLSQKPLVAESPKLWDQIHESERGDYTRGIMRVLGCAPPRDLPTTKKHEIFIPYPIEAESWPTIPIALHAIERFYEIADDRTGSDPALPYEPRGTQRNADYANPRYRLKAGDLVFFNPNESGTAVDEIAFSSIWRGRVESSWNGGVSAARTFDFFTEIDPELVPFDPYRKQITLAEQLFGFVEDEKAQDSKSSLALAGRVYFSHAQTNTNDCLLPAVTLRVLDSPKPPSPALYFKKRRGANGYIKKSSLTLADHTPHGRKFYLHHRLQDINQQCWRTVNEQERTKQKVKITPIKSGTVFHFHVNFDNLSAREIGLLLYALKPTSQFKHKIGMGKPLGLGAINIEPVGLFRINRQFRYNAAGLFSPRYSECWIADDADKPSWPEIYQVERDANGAAINVAALREDFRATMNPDIRQAVELIGNPSNIRRRVVTPLVERNGREADSEQETFQWFVANDRQQAQALEPLNANSREMPTLNSMP